MGRAFAQENAAQRARLHRLVGSLTEQELLLPLRNGWPVYVALAHLAFWDQRSAVLVRHWRDGSVAPSPVDTHVVNEALAPFFIAISPRVAADLAVSCAEVIDRLLEEAPDSLIEAIAALGDKFRLFRSMHRKRHLDAIEAALGGA